SGIPISPSATSASGIFERGGSREDAADCFATPIATLEGVYRRHPPAYQGRAAEIMQGGESG
ncbi:MAG TPA: hypothetical protein VJ994_06470, partial [Paracoccaceae bacterium]|nr:hypothetical protein [Paracoccaceae bacterium]